MKTKSKFKALPREDQDWIFRLCQNNTFEKAVEILEKPGPEGLALKTSYSAVRRFYLEYNPDAQQAQILDQYAQGLRIQHQSIGGNFDSAILVQVQSRILDALAKGKPIADLQVEMKTMINLQKTFIATEKWRADAGDKAIEDRVHFIETCARAGKQDFKSAIPGDDTPFVEESRPEFVEEDITDEDIARLDKAISAGDTNAVANFYAVEGFPIELIKERRKLHQRGVCPVASPARTPATATNLRQEDTPESDNSIVPFDPEKSSGDRRQQPALAANIHQKSPVKPHYPPKFTSSGNGKLDPFHNENQEGL